jgi:hypothetical protein
MGRVDIHSDDLAGSGIRCRSKHNHGCVSKTAERKIIFIREFIIKAPMRANDLEVHIHLKPLYP